MVVVVVLISALLFAVAIESLFIALRCDTSYSEALPQQEWNTRLLYLLTASGRSYLISYSLHPH